MARTGLAAALAIAFLAISQAMRTDLRQMVETMSATEAGGAKGGNNIAVEAMSATEAGDVSVTGGKCQKSCKSISLNPWLSCGSDEEIHQLLDAKCEFRSCSKCDGKKHGTWTPCCAAGGCSREPVPSPVKVEEDGGAAQLQADIEDIKEIASHLDVDGEEDGIDIDEFKHVCEVAASTGITAEDASTGITDKDGEPQGVEELPAPSVEKEDKETDSTPAAESGPVCPRSVLWNHKGWPRCRNSVNMQFVKTSCCKAEIEREVYGAVAARMCESLDNSDCKDAQRKARKKAHQGPEKVQGHLQKIFKEASVPGKFPQGFKCAKMYYCDTGSALVGPLNSCHVQLPTGDYETIGQMRNTCAAVGPDDEVVEPEDED